MKKLIFGFFLSILISFSFLFADTKSGINNSETINLVERMDVNKIDLPLNNNGSTGEDAQAYYPNGQTNLSFLFSGGFATTAYVNGELRASWMTPASLIEEWQPGAWGMDPNDPLAKFYIVNSSDKQGSTAFLNWQDAVNLGADFQDLDGNGIYNPNVDKPAITGDRMIWFPINDNTDVAQRTPRLNTAPIGIETHVIAWAWNRNDEFEDAVFFRYRFINATSEIKEDLIFSIWADSDIGDADDDLIGCDTTISLGYTYNDNSDDTQYGSNPPAFGIQFLQGAIVPATGDTAYRIHGNFLGIDTLYNMKNLPMTSFMIYGNVHPILGDPTNVDEARFYQIGGLDTQGNSIDPTSWGIGGTSSTNPKYFYSGNPVTGSGWIDSQSSDKRFLINCGPFNLAVGDTQDIIIAYEVSQGTSALNSVEILKQRATFFDQFLPFGKLLSIHTNKTIAPTDSNFIFTPLLSSFSASDTIQSASWQLTSRPTGSSASLVSGSGFTSILDPDFAGDYSIELQAIIGTGETVIENITVNAVYNHPPNVVFSIIPNPIIFGQSMQINASGSSDPDFDILHYNWWIPTWLEQNSIDTSYIEFYPPHTGSEYIDVTVNDLYFSVTERDSFEVVPLENGLELLTTFHDYSSIVDLKFIDDKMFILDDIQYLSIIDVTNYSTLLSRELIGTEKFITDGEYVISVFGNTSVVIGQLDSSNNYIQRSHIFDVLLNGSLADIYLNFPYLYIPVESPRELRIYNISNPLNPSLINSYTLPILTKDVSFSGNYAALYSRFPNLGIITLDISNPNFIVALDTLNITIDDRNIEYESGKIYALNGVYNANEIIVINAVNPSLLMQTATINIESILTGAGSNPILDVNAFGDFLFVENIDGIKLFDVSDLNNPIEKTNFHTGLNVSAVAWNKPYLYTGIPGDTLFGAGLNVLEFDSTHILNDVDEKISIIPSEYKIFQNFPNPFNPTTTIKYNLPKISQVKIQIFNILGQTVRTLVNNKQIKGSYDVIWDGSDSQGKQVASGIYFYSLQTEDFVKTKKMLLIR
jgi:flagellar hook capping protein FlgD/LVIVD repeat-containing protein